MEHEIPPAASLRLPDMVFFLYPGKVQTLGRAAENDIVLQDPKVSRVHAVFEWSSSGFMIRDNHSANGTYVNSQRLSETPHLLHDGDTVGICGLIFLYVVTRSETDPAPAPAEREQPGRAALTVLSGPDSGQRYPLWGEQITIGRASHEATWEIRLTDRSVSRPHARMERGSAGYVLTDLESANGTLLNGAPLREPVLLHNEDIIGVGDSILLFTQP